MNLKRSMLHRLQTVAVLLCLGFALVPMYGQKTESDEKAPTPQPPLAPVAPVAPAPRLMPPPGTFSSNSPSLVAIISIIGAFTLVGVQSYFRFQRSRMLHETLRTMIEKGMPIPPDLLKMEGERKRPVRSDLRKGLVSIAVGGGLMLFPEKNIHSVGWIFVCVGLAYIINWFVEQRMSVGQKQQSAQS